MPRFDVYVSPSEVGYVLDLQADILEGLNTRIVVPLLPLAEAPVPAGRLNPVFNIEGAPHVMVTQFMAAVPHAYLSSPVTNLSARDTEIGNALDMVFVGF